MNTQILNSPTFANPKRYLSTSLSGIFMAFLIGAVPAWCQQDVVTQVAERLKPNVVVINATFSDNSQEDGFGFITGEKDGKVYIVTAGHVVHRKKDGALANRITIEIKNSLETFNVKEVRWFEPDDLSLLVVNAIPGFTWEKKCLGKNPKIYDKVRFIGRNKNWVSPSEGEIYSIEGNIIEFSISTIAPGTSGAPLIGKSGIIGMITDDEANTSQALSLTRILELIGRPQYPYVSALAFVEDFFDPNMVRLKGGTYTMGCTSEQGSDCESNEKPSHQVTVSDFYIGKYEVTQKEWRDIMGSSPSNFKNYDQCPVEQVSWDDIQEFLRKLNAKTGKNYRLPTEAEWEYAARGGSLSQKYKYAGSNNVDEVAWYSSNSGSKTHPVGEKNPNELGLYDMSGNVEEWCGDGFGVYPSDIQTNHQGPSTGLYRSLRGGSWKNKSQYCRIASRGNDYPHSRTQTSGFRLARSL